MADPGISEREGRRAWDLGTALKPMVGVQGAKPPEADEFLHVKGGFIKIMIMYILKKYVIFFPNGGGGGGGG